MREFNNFIFFSSDKSSNVAEIYSLIKKESIGDVNLISHRSDVIELISSKGFFALYIDELNSKRDIEIILRFILNAGFHKNKYFYLATHDPSSFKSILETFYMFDLKVVNLPQASSEIVKQIVNHLRPPENKSVPKIKGLKKIDEIDLNFLKLFIDATLKVVKEMSFDDSITHLSPILLEQLESPPNIAIRGMLEIETKPYNGLFFISFPKETYLNLYEKVVGEKSDEINHENEDFAKELMNIIYGEAKKNFSNLGYGEELGKLIPSLSKESSIDQEQSVVVIPYESSFGSFYIKVAPKARRS